MVEFDRASSRRRFLAFLAGSAGVAYSGGDLAHALEAPGRLPDPMVWGTRDLEKLIAAPADAINVFDLETVARAKVPPAHFGYLASGIDDEVTLRANREDFLKFYLRPRRLVDVSKVDMSVRLFGETYPTPILVAPIGGQHAFDPGGELTTAAGAKTGDHLMMLSTQASTPVEQVNAARGRPVWFQLYSTNKFEVALAMSQRAERAGCTVLAVTVDRKGGRNQETGARLRRTDTRQCIACHNSPTGPTASLPRPGRQPMFDGIDLTGLANTQASAMNWDYLKRVRDGTRMKCVVKGILTAEDAAELARLGYDGIIVSNHGGRADDSGRSTIEALPEVLAAVRGRIPVLVDSGFRRGTDIVKALAMGAAGVAVGRPYLWGLGAFGQAGVERALELLRTETYSAMQQVGAPNLKALTPAMVRHI